MFIKLFKNSSIEKWEMYQNQNFTGGPDMSRKPMVAICMVPMDFWRNSQLPV